MIRQDTGNQTPQQDTKLGHVFGFGALVVGSLVAYANKNSISEGIRRELDPALAELNKPALIPRLTSLGDPKEIEAISYDEKTDSYVALSNGTESRYPRNSSYTQEGDPENPSANKTVQAAMTDDGKTVYVLTFSGEVLPYNDDSKNKLTNKGLPNSSVSSL